MERRVFLAIALSLLILLAYQAIIGRMYPIAQQEVKQLNKLSKQDIPLSKQKTVSSFQGERKEKLFNKETKKFILVFSNIGGKIKEIFLKEYNNTLLERDLAVIQGFENVAFKLSQKNGSVIYSYKDEKIQIIKEFDITEDGYTIGLNISFRNLDTITEERSFRIYNSSFDLKQYSKKQLAGREKYFLEFSVATPAKIWRSNFARASKKAREFLEPFEWVGVRDRYFCTILFPISATSVSFTQPIDKQKVVSGIETSKFVFSPGTSYDFNAQFYVGPQDIKKLSKSRRGFEHIVSFGFFDIISQVLLSIMRFMYSFIHNWGICIILISLLIYLVLFPMTAKSLVSMKKMQALQPEIEKLRQAFKDQPQRLNKELMELYRENKVNPFGGCFPIFLQIPVFFGLYQVLMRSIELKGAKFLWIKDLAEPDRLMVLKNTYPIIGDEINLLPLIMLVAMFVQQKISMKSSSSSTMQEQQKMMMFLFPLLFGFLFYHFPSGLTLYWVSYTILSIFSQRRIARTV
jgi:YidC/Oxa1 family membrane protein insertase